MGVRPCKVIDFDCLRPAGEQFTPLFETTSEYQEFRERYEADLAPELREQASKRRQSEEAARRRLVGWVGGIGLNQMRP